MKRIGLLVLVLFLSVSYGNASSEFDREVLEEAGLNIEEVHVGIPGLTRTYHFLWVSDLHIVIDSEEIADDQHDLVASRQSSWAIRSDGKQSGDWWVESLAETINASNPDAIILGGDMLDLCSEATIEKLREGLKKINVPRIYIRADHDIGTHWLKNPDKEKNNELQAGISDNEPILKLEYPEFVILGINNNTLQMKDDAVDQAKEIAVSGKPVIVVTHIPYDSIVDRGLEEVSRAAWQDRNLTWGENTNYVPGAKMQEWMNIIFSDDTYIVEILAGHLHLSWDGMVTKRVHEHVFSQAFSGDIGLIIVSGE